MYYSSRNHRHVYNGYFSQGTCIIEALPAAYNKKNGYYKVLQGLFSKGQPVFDHFSSSALLVLTQGLIWSIH